MYKRIAWPVKTVLHLVFVLIYIYQGFVIAQLCYWTSTSVFPFSFLVVDTDFFLHRQDRSSDHFLNGQPFESAPPLIFGIIAALVQSLLGVRVTSVGPFLLYPCPSTVLTLPSQLIPRRKWRYIFGGVLAAMIAFALTSATLVFAVNISVRSLRCASGEDVLTAMSPQGLLQGKYNYGWVNFKCVPFLLLLSTLLLFFPSLVR